MAAAAAGGSWRAAASADGRSGAVARDARLLRRRNRRLDRRALRGRLPDALPRRRRARRGASAWTTTSAGMAAGPRLARTFPRTLPENWAIRLRLRGEGPPQTLEFKLLDPSGKNVWWSVRRDFAFPSDWTTLTIRKRQVTFAWGPAGGGVLTDLGAIEITVTAASGGRGRVWIDELALDVLPPPGAPPAPLAEWRSAPGSGEEQTVRLDLGGRREIGGISLFWDADDYARLYDVEMSDDGTRVAPRAVDQGRTRRTRLDLPSGHRRGVRPAASPRERARPGLRAPGASRRAARDRGLAHEVPRSRREGGAARPLAALARGRADLLDARRRRRRKREGSALRGRRPRDGPGRVLGRALPACRRPFPGMGGGIADRALARGGRSADPVRAPHLRRRTLPHGDGLRRRIARLLHDARPVPRRELGPGARDGRRSISPCGPCRSIRPGSSSRRRAARRPSDRSAGMRIAGRSSSRTPMRSWLRPPRPRSAPRASPRARSSRDSPRATCRSPWMPPIPTGSPPPRWRSTSRFLREARRTSSSPCRFRRRRRPERRHPSKKASPPPPATGGQSSRASSSPFRPRPSRSRGPPARTWPGS